jgi:transcription elongation factor Elf1
MLDTMRILEPKEVFKMIHNFFCPMCGKEQIEITSAQLIDGKIDIVVVCSKCYKFSKVLALGKVD